MILLVNDAGILIDLLKADLIEPFFRLTYEFHVTDFVIGEVQEENADSLAALIQAGRLKKWVFDFEELLQIQQLEVRHKALSIPDCSCLFLAGNLSATLLTGDSVLRKIAEKNDIPVHGLLWVLDELVRNRRMTPRKACQKLEKLMKINPRLPLAECRKRLVKWKKGF